MLLHLFQQALPAPKERAIPVIHTDKPALKTSEKINGSEEKMEQ